MTPTAATARPDPRRAGHQTRKEKHMPIRIGRWQLELYGRSLYIQKQADPHCATCHGSGEIQSGPGVGPDGEEPDIHPCSCWNPYRSIRIPFWRKPAADGWPF